MSGSNRPLLGSPGLEIHPHSFLARLEHREDLERLCARLVGDALFARRLAKRQAREGHSSEAVRCHAIARDSARRALYILWAFRAADHAVTESGGAE